ncbi:hypothetical protein A9Q99_22065 [Gammaproteobacteria bacterium 45_16_T64]|nr:hypothetical protein A9Q99_22065 [Gammaproteobacteria bacterium 45_16_T64]
MGVTVGVNMMSVIHKDSGGVTIAFPDVCNTPSPAGPVPIPYPNIAMSSDTADGAQKVTADGNPICLKTSTFSTSTGDEAGSNNGLASGKTKGVAEFMMASFNVKVEGAAVPKAFDIMLHNDKNTPPFPVLQGPIIAMPSTDEVTCVCCSKAM